MFTIGDRVQITGVVEPLDNDDIYVGQLGTITRIDPTDPDEHGDIDPYPYLVEFDEPVDDYSDNFFAEAELTKLEG